MAPRVYSHLRLGDKTRQPVLNILRRWEQLSAENLRFLREQVSVTLVTIPEALAVEQLDSILNELAGGGIQARSIIINNVACADGSDFLTERACQQKRYLDLIREKCSALKITEVPLFPAEIKGLTKLAKIAEILYGA